MYKGIQAYRSLSQNNSNEAEKKAKVQKLSDSSVFTVKLRR